MPTWSRQAMADMADLINKRGNTADTVATLRYLIIQWANAHPNQTLSKSFSGDGLRFPVVVTLDRNEIVRVDMS